LTKKMVSASMLKPPYGTVATTEVRYENRRIDYKEDSDEETVERWVAHPGDILRILNLQKELEGVKERVKKEQASEWEVTPSTDNNSSDNSLLDIYHKDTEEVTTMTTPTSLKIPPRECENHAPAVEVVPPGGEVVIIVNVYDRHTSSESVRPAQRAAWGELARHRRVIVAGDMNAHSKVWNRRTTRPRNNVIWENLIEEHGLMV